MLLIVGWLGLSIIVGVAANTRGRDPFKWFAISLLLSPLFGGLLLFALPYHHSSKPAKKPLPPHMRVVFLLGVIVVVLIIGYAVRFLDAPVTP